jgi:AhpC/TSA antioxidant enzyme
LREHEGEFGQRGVRVAVVTFGSPYFAAAYARESALPWPILLDETREAYRRYGMLSASFLGLWGPATWRAYFRELRKGARLRKADGDIHQQGGDVLIDPAGIIVLHHVGAGPADRPGPDRILEPVRARSGVDTPGPGS